jgi:hypothetical protein
MKNLRELTVRWAIFQEYVNRNTFAFVNESTLEPSHPKLTLVAAKEFGRGSTFRIATAKVQAEVLQLRGRVLPRIRGEWNKPTSSESRMAPFVDIVRHARHDRGWEDRAPSRGSGIRWLRPRRPNLVKIAHEVTAGDRLLTPRLYPLVREGIPDGLHYPNRDYKFFA